MVNRSKSVDYPEPLHWTVFPLSLSHVLYLCYLGKVSFYCALQVVRYTVYCLVWSSELQRSRWLFKFNSHQHGTCLTHPLGTMLNDKSIDLDPALNSYPIAMEGKCITNASQAAATPAAWLPLVPLRSTWSERLRPCAWGMDSLRRFTDGRHAIPRQESNGLSCESCHCNWRCKQVLRHDLSALRCHPLEAVPIAFLPAVLEIRWKWCMKNEQMHWHFWDSTR